MCCYHKSPDTNVFPTIVGTYVVWQAKIGNTFPKIFQYSWRTIVVSTLNIGYSSWEPINSTMNYKAPSNKFMVAVHVPNIVGIGYGVHTLPDDRRLATTRSWLTLWIASRSIWQGTLIHRWRRCPWTSTSPSFGWLCFISHNTRSSSCSDTAVVKARPASFIRQYSVDLDMFNISAIFDHL